MTDQQRPGRCRDEGQQTACPVCAATSDAAHSSPSPVVDNTVAHLVALRRPTTGRGARSCCSSCAALCNGTAVRELLPALVQVGGKGTRRAKVRKRYHPPATPCQRLMENPLTPASVRAKLAQMSTQLDPVRLLSDMRTAQQRLVTIADRSCIADSAVTEPALDQFLSGLRTAWKDGEIRPTAVPKPKQKRERRRPDPLVAVTGQLRAWFDEEPWRTGRELLERLQAEHPGQYPDHLLRTLQRRLKIWRKEKGLCVGVRPDESRFGNRAACELMRC